LSEQKEREVLQLLKDIRSYESPFGGAMPLGESGVIDAAYGPAGLVESGQEFPKSDRAPLAASFKKLRLALRVLRAEDFDAWASLIAPYLGDPADPGVVGHWRKLVAVLDEENAKIRAENERRRKKGRPVRTQLERHDRAVRRLAEILRRKRLHPVYPKLMSERERVAGEAANAQMMAYYQRVRVAGRTHRGAVSQTAVKFGISDDEAERIVEFRGESKLASCAEPECLRNVYSQNLCSKHYQRDLKARRRAG
jgi:hypothetical protein